MELTTNQFSFEILQIESVALFVTIVTATISTWLSFRESAGSTGNREFWAVVLVGTFLCLAGVFCYALGAAHFILAVELAFAVVLSVMRPANALAVFVCLQFLRPWEIGEENALLLALPRMTGLLAIASAVAAYLRSDIKRLTFGKAQWYLIAFAIWTLLTTFIAPNPGDQQKEYFDTFFRAIVVFFLIVAVIQNDSDLRLLRSVYMWSVAGLALVSIYISWDEIWGANSTGGDRLHAIGTLENANDIAAVMVIGIPFAIRRLSMNARKPWVWLESGSFLLITLIALYLAQSRGALLALAIAGIGYWVLRSKRRWMAIGAGVFIMACCAPFANDVLRRDSEDLNESSTSRITYWKAGIKMVIKSPVFGVGFGRYPKEYQGNAGGGEQFEFGERTAHSTWILALAETGVPGLIFFLAFVWAVLKMGRKVIPHEPDLYVSLIAYLIAISFLSHTYLIYPYLLMGMVVAAYRVHFRSAKGWAL